VRNFGEDGKGNQRAIFPFCLRAVMSVRPRILSRLCGASKKDSSRKFYSDG
jgi:hypothetical protein